MNEWNYLMNCFTNGDYRIDNNYIESHIRPFTIGRKNWMFAGSPEGGHRAATIYSIVCTCGLLGVEPGAYLKDVLQRLAEGADATLLTPRLWLASRTA